MNSKKISIRFSVLIALILGMPGITTAKNAEEICLALSSDAEKIRCLQGTNTGGSGGPGYFGSTTFATLPESERQRIEDSIK